MSVLDLPPYLPHTAQNGERKHRGKGVSLPPSQALRLPSIKFPGWLQPKKLWGRHCEGNESSRLRALAARNAERLLRPTASHWSAMTEGWGRQITEMEHEIRYARVKF
ncbi:hypothetical protein TNCV_1960811 [Trichonephila clavipes]|nr:hypothetical protein TNCV_1960811 [Trichonephila clavipes]